jgi:hypothetical protein
MKPNAGFLSLPEEIQFNILSFLACRDILRCTSVSSNHDRVEAVVVLDGLSHS